MKKIIFLAILFLSLLFPVKLFAQDTGWVIENFSSNIIVNKDTFVNVTEAIEVDFRNLEKHGIYRTIPVKYKTEYGNNLNIDLKVESITDEVGNLLKYSKSKKGNSVELKIGDPNILITGKQTYVIDYEISRVITTPNKNAEFYWNVTGNDWPVEILKSSATITSPEDSSLNTICFTGFYGESSADCTHSTNGTVSEFSTGTISPGEGFTVSVEMKLDSFVFPTLTENLIYFLKNNWIYLTPLFVFCFMFLLYLKRGRDKQFFGILGEDKKVKSVPLFAKVNAMTTFGPPGDLSPGEVGTLIDERVHPQDITAIIIDLAVRGYIKIKESKPKGLIKKKSEFTFTLLKKDTKDLVAFENSVIDMLFGKERKTTSNLDKLPKNAYKYLKDVQDNLYEHLVNKGYYEKNPEKVRTKYLIIGIIVIAVGSFLGGMFAFLINPVSLIFSSITSGLIIVAFSFFMPSRTGRGRRALEEAAGLKEYLRVGAWRQKKFEQYNFFEKVLPYTIAFGMTQKFIKAFKEADIKNLEWYETSRSINVIHFSNSINSITPSVKSGVAATVPKSASSGGSGFSGGGFSGGGFGGGGGGSW